MTIRLVKIGNFVMDWLGVVSGAEIFLFHFSSKLLPKQIK